ncbi:MAG: carbohydrate-binding domain-containing protein, partial [Clostridia bacterium]|nr:carbohydrate-binding domain-containing protein [Clostridia bacterium]
YICFVAFLLAVTAVGQTFNVQVGNVVYRFPASRTGDMEFVGGNTLVVMGKSFALADVDAMSVNEVSVQDNNVIISYNGGTAMVEVPGNVARFVDVAVDGAYVNITQTNIDAVDGDEITYTLCGTTTDGGFFLYGEYKCTVQLAGLELTNTDGAAIEIANGKRIKLSAKNGTVNSLTDGSGGSHKGCIYSKGQLQIQGNGVLNVTGNTKHAIKSGDYISVKNLTLNITKAIGDGISCNEYFLMESGLLTISSVGDDGIQCDLDGDSSTGDTVDHEDEDSGNMYIHGGTINVFVTTDAAKGIKSEGVIKVYGGDVAVTTSGGGVWDSEDVKTKASSCIDADSDIFVSGGALNLASSGAGGKGVSGNGTFTAVGGVITVSTSGDAVVASSNGVVSTVASSQQLDRYSSDYKSSPKGIKVDGAILISDSAVVSVTTAGAGGEGVESKHSIGIAGGQLTVDATDDAINASYETSTGGTGDISISGGMVYARSTGNDGIDSNGNCYIKGGVVYAVGSSQPEVAVDANSEGQKKLYVTGGTIIAIGGLESGSSLTQTCYQTSSWNRNTWYAMTVGSETFAFRTPASGGSTLVVSGTSQPTLKSGITVNNGTEIFNGNGFVEAVISGGSSVTLSSYSGGTGGGGGRPGWN